MEAPTKTKPRKIENLRGWNSSDLPVPYIVFTDISPKIVHSKQLRKSIVGPWVSEISKNYIFSDLLNSTSLL